MTLGGVARPHPVPVRAYLLIQEGRDCGAQTACPAPGTGSRTACLQADVRVVVQAGRPRGHRDDAARDAADSLAGGAAHSAQRVWARRNGTRRRAQRGRWAASLEDCAPNAADVRTTRRTERTTCSQLAARSAATSPACGHTQYGRPQSQFLHEQVGRGASHRRNCSPRTDSSPCSQICSPSEQFLDPILDVPASTARPSHR